MEVKVFTLNYKIPCTRVDKNSGWVKDNRNAGNTKKNLQPGEHLFRLAIKQTASCPAQWHRKSANK